MSKKNCNFVAFLIIKLRSMKKSTILFGVVAIVAMVMVSCQMDKPTFQEANLLGKWIKDDATGLDSVPVEFVRFTDELDPTREYKYGRQWNVSEDIYEEDLKPYGNGWFKYKLVNSKLTEIHLMDNGGADVPKIYTVLQLTDDVLKYRDDRGVITTFVKVE